MHPLSRRNVLKGLAAGGVTAGIAAVSPASRAWADVGTSPRPSSDPGNTGGWTLDPQFSDEFIGRHLDPAKWYDHITYWEGRAPSYFDPANVAVHRGRATIPFRNVNTVTNPSFQDGLAGWHAATTGVQVVDDTTAQRASRCRSRARAISRSAAHSPPAPGAGR